MDRWISAISSKPKQGVQVLCIKQAKNGARSLCFGAWYDPTPFWPEGRWVTTGSCNNVRYWMPLPEIIEASED